MYINTIKTNYISKTSYSNIKTVRHLYNKNEKPIDTFFRQSKTINFRGKPSEISYVNNLSKYSEISAETAIQIYKCLKYHKYTDIPQPSWNFQYEPSYDNIIENNLKFLDNIKSDREKRWFINYYEELTGFPNLEICSSKIENEFCNVSISAIKDLSSKYKEISIADIGYNDTCSVGHKKALPGSDIDGGYVILDTDNLPYYYDSSIINEFKEYLWNNTDARILSYNHTAAFPQVYSKRQINNLLNSMEKETQNMNLCKTVYSSNFFRTITMLKHYQNLLKAYNTDYIAANQFYIQLSKRFEDTTIVDYNNPSKEIAKNFGFLTETIINGKSLAKDNGFSLYDSPLRKRFYSTQYAKLVNLSQLQALKRNPTPKPKLKARAELIEIYKNASVHEKYEIVKEIIRAGCEHNHNDKYSKYFACGSDKFTPLLKELKGIK